VREHNSLDHLRRSTTVSSGRECWGLLGGGRGLGLVDQKVKVDCFRARHGENLLGFCGGDGGHGLLEASSVNRLHKKGILCAGIRDYLRRQPDISLVYYGGILV
jgi:hypothetical protein